MWSTSPASCPRRSHLAPRRWRRTSPAWRLPSPVSSGPSPTSESPAERSRTIKTIYEEIGGAPAVAGVVDAFYDRLLADPSVNGYFAGKDLARLKAHQRALVTVALGGASETYTGRLMGPAHAGLGITDEAFDTILSHLDDVMTGAGVGATTVAKVLAILEPLRPDVVESRARAAI